MDPSALSSTALAKAVGVTPARISEIVRGCRDLKGPDLMPAGFFLAHYRPETATFFGGKRLQTDYPERQEEWYPASSRPPKRLVEDLGTGLVQRNCQMIRAESSGNTSVF